MKELTICFSFGGKKDEGRMREKRDGADRKQRAESKKTPTTHCLHPAPAINLPNGSWLTYTQKHVHTDSSVAACIHS